LPACDGPSLKIARTCKGRAVYTQSDGTLYLSRHYEIHASRDDGGTWTRVTAMPRSPVRRLAELSRLACRALRHEVRAFLVLSDGRYVAANREWVFHAAPGDTWMTPSRMDAAGHGVMPPMALGAGPGDRVLWGEYGPNRERREMRLFVSDDGGRTHEVAYVFPPGEIRHVHNVVFDPKIEAYWVLAGDHGTDPGIGRLSGDLRRFEWVVKGQQQHRAVCVFDRGDHLLYATDTEMETNALMRLHKATGRIERLFDLPGSCIYACQFGGLLALTSTVEPSPVNECRDGVLWLSRDGDSWWPAFRAAKDRWNECYFQFGSIVLPRGASDREAVFFSGQALRGIDGRAMVAVPAR